jgi:uncharacterized membrane protein YvlD (DUF360 family)
MHEYNELHLKMIAFIIAAIVASILPLCSIFMLSLIRSKTLQLGAIVILSSCFSLALAVMTNARQIEIFAATSA